MAQTYDAIVIGTGQAGPSLAAKLTGEGLKTAVIERKLLGGTCVNVGCIPTKALVASARAAHMARRSEDFGVVIGGPRRGGHEAGQGPQGRRRATIERGRERLAQEHVQLHGV